MSGYKIQNIDTIRMNGKNIGSGTLSNGELGYHNDGSTQGMRCRVGGFNGQIDLTAF